MISKISNAFAWLGGANLTVLSRAPTVRGKFVQMGLVLLTTASIAVVSMTFFMRQEIKEPETSAVIVAIFWGLIILNLDRFLVISMGATRNKGRLFLMAAPRLILAIVISLVISTPITLRIFQSDIDYQLRASQATQSEYLNGLEAKSAPAQQAKQLATKIGQDQAILNGHLPQAVSNPQLLTAQQQVQQLQPQVTAAKQQEIAAYATWQCELYGDGASCDNASDRPGDGPIAHAKQQLYEQALGTYNSLNAQLSRAEHNVSVAEASLKQAQAAALTRYRDAALSALPGLQALYNKDEAQITSAHASDQAAIGQHTGTLAQLSALWEAGAGNPMLMLAHLTIMALFFLIELLPVLVKVLLNLGPLDPYEKVLEVEEETTADRARMERLTTRRDAERNSDEERKKADAASRARIKVAEDRANHEQALGIKANKYVAEKMEKILDAALQHWSGQVTGMLSNASAGGQPAGANTTGMNTAGTNTTGVNTAGVNPGGVNTAHGPGTPANVTGIPPLTGALPGTGRPNGTGAAPNGSGPASGNGAPPQGFGLPPAGSTL